MGELRSGMSGGGAGNRREVGEVAVVAGGGVGIGERRPRNRRPVGARWEAGSTDESNGLPSRCSCTRAASSRWVGFSFPLSAFGSLGLNRIWTPGSIYQYYIYIYSLEQYYVWEGADDACAAVFADYCAQRGKHRSDGC